MRILIAFPLESEMARLREAFPDPKAVEFVISQDPEALRAAATTAEVILGGRLVVDLLKEAPQLRWVQTSSAGVDRLPMALFAEREILLSNAGGAYGSPISENILALMLAFAIRLPTFLAAQQRGEWIKGNLHESKFELEGQTLLVVGLGDIGGTLARKANALGMRVLGARRRPLPPPPGVDEVIAMERLDDALAQADHVALCLPLTSETTGFLNEVRLRRMKPTAYLYNVGRGRSVDREALLRALREGWIAGAGLDVTDPEPLPPDDPLWSLPNVILTQHTSGFGPSNYRRIADIFIANLRRYLAGEPLENVVDPQAGY